MLLSASFISMKEVVIRDARHMPSKISQLFQEDFVKIYDQVQILIEDSDVSHIRGSVV